jgi:hypothetical protein
MDALPCWVEFNRMFCDCVSFQLALLLHVSDEPAHWTRSQSESSVRSQEILGKIFSHENNLGVQTPLYPCLVKTFKSYVHM